MTIADGCTTTTTRATTRPTVSFELFPPRTPQSTDQLWTTIEALAAVRPDFISVTYGASGSTRQTTRELVHRLLERTPVLPIAHLTCVGASRSDVATVVNEFLDEGVRNFLALRGDPPQDQPDWTPHPDGLSRASELVELIREVETARCGSSASEALRGAARKLSVAVAAFPHGNPKAGSSRAQDLRALLAKQEAGADFAITQVFFDPADYLDLVRDARAVGVTIPIVAGVIPTTDPGRLLRVEALTGVQVPSALLARLASTDSPVERHRIGIRASVDLANAVLDGGAPGLHVYTFNKHEAALDLLEGAHLGGGAPTAPDQASGPRVSTDTMDYVTI
ncbi:methylenetetrahydrofolate reductase [Cellulomonas fimi]|uniref:Methylenetetrahydrofolate reductase n=1 Tax=Cellulomonas fimi TaxID=1708 RepID=A0A7Y0QJE5_CELFI|nr:methylenetetrahydrofolate reductase [Cellulomonas fimi]NMR21257.1 methylenetetrahydrofolate reductase [Cellulomonas fimi]